MDNKKFLRYVLHCLGLGCLISAVFLEALTFRDILLKGYFFANEPNQLVLVAEVGLTAFAILYTIFLCIQFFLKLKGERK